MAYLTLPGSFATSLTLSTGVQGAAFGFQSRSVQLVNDGPVRCFFDFSTGGVSTGSVELKAGETWFRDVATTGVSMLTTSTSTSDNALPTMRVSAFGG